MDFRPLGMETPNPILQVSGHTLLVRWETIFEVLGSVCWPTPSDSASYLVPPEFSTSRGCPPPLGYLQEKDFVTLIKFTFQYMTLKCYGLAALFPEHLRHCINTLG